MEKIWSKVAPLFAPLGFLYGVLMLLRRKAYRKGFLAAYRPRALVISVGNLTLGGEGKTPLVLWLANFLEAKGIRAAILTKGYRGKLKGPAIASRGEGPLLRPDEIGDEAFLLALKSKSPVMVARDRVQGAFWAIKEFEAEILILDDGFQHLRLERDLDLVLFSAEKNHLAQRVFPAGRLREPWAVLKEASALLLTKINQAGEVDKALYKKLKSFQKPLFRIPYKHLRPYLLGKPGEGPSTLPFKIFAFAGLGDNHSFCRSLKDLGCEIVGFWPFPDHVKYNKQLVEHLLKKAKALKAEAFLTTEKDAVKLLEFQKLLKPCYVLPLEPAPGRDFEEFILQRIRHRARF